MLTKGDLFAETIVDLTSEGLGVAKTNTEDGRLYPVFVKDTAIGDRIEGIITKTSKTFAYGKMLKLLKLTILMESFHLVVQHLIQLLTKFIQSMLFFLYHNI